MNKLKEIFKKLTAYDHFLVFLIILFVLKIVDVFSDNGLEAGLHFLQMGIALFAISSIVFFAFRHLFDKKKKYQHALISTFLILLMLSHENPEPIRGLLVILLLYLSKFTIKYKKQNIFNPVVFAIGMATILAIIIPELGIPPLDWSGIDIRFNIAGTIFPIAIVPIILSIIFNVGRIKKHSLALSFIISSLIFGLFLQTYDHDPISYVLITGFIGAAILIEPKTSPIKTQEQIIYGVSIACMYFALTYINLPNAPITGLMVGNALYFLYKQKKVTKYKYENN